MNTSLVATNDRQERKPLHRMRAPALALLALLSAAAPSAAQSLADTDDVLDGTRYLVRADDLVVADPALATTSSTDVSYFSLDTEDGVITTAENVAAKPVVEPPCIANPDVSTPFPQQTQTMRLFDLAYDVIVTLAPASTTSGAGCGSGQPNSMAFYVDDPKALTRQTWSVGSAGITTRWLHTAVADFNQDGFDDLFIISDEWAYVATAQDTSKPANGVVIRSSFKFDETAMADPAIGDFNADGNLDVAWMGASFTAGAIPAVHFATICAGPVAGTICAGAASFAIKSSSAVIAPKAPTGSLVTVGGKCTENDNNQAGSELRAPAMAVAAGQYDGSPGAELLVAALYEDSGNECKVVAEVYSFTTFTGSGTTGESLTPTLESTLDNLSPHNHIASPASIYAAAGRLNWNGDTDNVAIAISGGTEHNIMVISFTAGLAMTLRDHPFDSGNVNKSFAGLAIGRFSSAPAADASTSCSQDSQCTDTCKSSVCEISGTDCTADGDCTGVCTTDGVCSYIKPNNYNLQIAAFLMARNSDEHFSFVYIYSADPVAAFAPKEIQNFNVENFGIPAMDRGYRGGSLLRAGDLEGRSQRLGTPTVVRIETNIQPDLIVAVPPMHADWLSFGAVGESQFCEPTGNCTTSFSPSNICNCTDPESNTACPDGSELRCLFNFSSLAGTYTSRYDFDETQTNQSESTETTSWSLGVSVDLSGKVKSLTPEGTEATQQLAFAADNSYDHSVSKTNSSFKTETFNASTSTGFYDHVWYTARDYSVFYYPVIGQTICVDSCEEPGVCSISGVACEDDADCPNDFTSCPDADKQPLYVQYSGASSVKSFSDDGGNLEWYQPVHEPGQILSYPWDCDQLAARNGVNICDAESPDYSLLSEAASFSTDTTEQEYKLTWSGGGETSQTVDKSGQFSQKLTWTRTESTPEYSESEEGVKFTQSASINANEAVSTGRTNTSSFDASTGITVTRPGTFLTPSKFAYLVDGYIFGDAPAPGTLDNLMPTSADVQTTGVLRSAFTVDPRAGGSWWEGAGPYKQYVDVALNRPVHLKPDPGVGISSPGVTNCLAVSDDNISTADCVADYRADPTPKGLFNSQFYWLRGFFVTPADAVGQGPQLGQATEGDVLALQVRVYNYSLLDMDLGTIKVDFYAQEWDPQCNTPAGYYNHDQSCTQPGGGIVPCESSCDPCCIANQAVDSIWIGQDVLDPLPGFDSPNYPEQANWTVATTTFDTGAPSVCGSRGCGDKDFLFWVVVWPELADNNGNPALRAELPDHSLTRIPGRLKSIADVCTKDNDCVDGSCRATQGACVADTDCPGAEDNVCASDGTCAVSGTACSSDTDCGECLCALCLDDFSNNVGFFHQAFVIRPESTGATSASSPSNGASAGELAIEQVSVTPAAVRPGEDVLVRAGLRAVGAPINGQLVRFYAVPPHAAQLSVQEVFDTIRPFDVEILSRIRADRVHEAQAPFSSRQVGTHQILVSALVHGEEKLMGSAEVEVGTATAPTPTPTRHAVIENDDGCAISAPPQGASSATIVLAIAPLLFGLLYRSTSGWTTSAGPSTSGTSTSGGSATAGTSAPSSSSASSTAGASPGATASTPGGS